MTRGVETKGVKVAIPWPPLGCSPKSQQRAIDLLRNLAEKIESGEICVRSAKVDSDMHWFCWRSPWDEREIIDRRFDVRLEFVRKGE